MAHNSNSHDAPWLPNSQTEMFSFYAGMRSSCLVVGAVANCSTHAGLPHWNFDRSTGSVPTTSKGGVTFVDVNHRRTGAPPREFGK